jgi:hypothetical protein
MGVLDTSDVVISEDVSHLMTLGGYARTLPNRVYFPVGAFAGPGFIPWLIHELTHVWQYQQGASLPGMIWEALVGNYFDGDVDGLRRAWESGMAFDEFSTEQQADILSAYYARLTFGLDTSAFDGFVESVRTGTYKQHRYQPIKPLEAGALNEGKLHEDYRAKTEAEMVRLLRMPMRLGDERAVHRARRLVELFSSLSPYWSERYAKRIQARRPGDELVNLMFTQISHTTRTELFRVMGVPG